MRGFNYQPPILTQNEMDRRDREQAEVAAKIQADQAQAERLLPELLTHGKRRFIVAALQALDLLREFSYRSKDRDSLLAALEREFGEPLSLHAVNFLLILYRRTL